MNALRHGLTAQHVTVFDETEADFRRFHRQLMRVLRPDGAMEAQLAERAVICAWRLRRVYRIETGMFSKARKLWAPTGPTLASDIETVIRDYLRDETTSQSYRVMIRASSAR
jgi:hypothetical protein